MNNDTIDWDTIDIYEPETGHSITANIERPITKVTNIVHQGKEIKFVKEPGKEECALLISEEGHETRCYGYFNCEQDAIDFMTTLGEIFWYVGNNSVSDSSIAFGKGNKTSIRI